MMTSVLVSPDGKYEYEAAHGTVTRHYYRHLEGGAYLHQSGGHPLCLDRRPAQAGELDGLEELQVFADKLEAAAVATIEGGTITRDLAGLWEGETPARAVDSRAFLEAIREELIAAFDRRRTGGSAMKLAEALLLRSEHQKKLEELEARIQANLKVQEGDELQEDPEALLQAAMAEQEALCALVRRINRTNHALHLEGNMTLSDALAERDMLRVKRTLLARVAESARNRGLPPDP